MWRLRLRVLVPWGVVSCLGGTSDPLQVRLSDLSLKHGRLALDVRAVAHVVARRIVTSTVSSGTAWGQCSASRGARGKVLLWESARGWHDDGSFVRRQCLGRSGFKVLFSARVPGWLGIDILAL